MTSPTRAHGRHVEVESLEQLDSLLRREGSSMAGWRVQNLDLRQRGQALGHLDPGGALFLGCTFDPADEQSLRQRGALIFPDVPDVPFDPYRSALYTPAELYAGLEQGYEHANDAQIYAWTRRNVAEAHTDGVTATLAQSLHDLAIDEALRDYIQGRPVVGVMGGHAVRRDTEDYAAAVHLGRALSATGLLVTTGGGPGAMEAANLGAASEGVTEDALDGMLADLAAVPDFRPSVKEWADAAFRVADQLDGDVRTLGIPTWFYGHEPPNIFAAAVAKFFRNALREDTLLRLCGAGIVFLPGAAGTVQEIFQDACENYYASAGARTPMVLLGRDHWNRTFPVWPLLEALADSAEFRESVHVVDSWQEAVDIVTG
jgi:predicted Rossmann-fold nucleotide-binding protein